MTIRVAIVDGHTLLRYGLRHLVLEHADIEIVGECSSAAEAFYHDLGIVMLTSRGEDDLLFRALETGASAFVAKTAPVAEVIAAIRHAAVAASSFTAVGLAGALSRRRTATDGHALSQRENQVLGMLRDGMSVPAIATAMYVSQSTAKTYVARLYDKLGAANRSQALMTAVHLGLIGYEQGQVATAAVLGA